MDKQRLAPPRANRLRFVAIGMFGASLIINALANTTLLGGNTTAQVSDSYPTLFTPAGLTFAIWGVIYLLLLGYCWRLFARSRQTHDRSAASIAAEVAPEFMVASLLNAVWLVAWQYRVLWLSVILIIGLLITLGRICLRVSGERLSTADWLTTKLPFQVYFGWVTVATIANISVWLVSIKWDGWSISPTTWTITILLIGAAIGLATSWRLKSWPYIAVFAWAYLGIWLKHTAATGYDHAYPDVITTLMFLITLFLAAGSYFAMTHPKGMARS